MLIIFSAVGPSFTKYNYSTQNLEVVNIPPLMKVFKTPDNNGHLYITQSLKVLYVNPDGTLGGQLKKVRSEDDQMMTIFDYNGTEIALYYGQKPYVIADQATKVIYPSERVWNKSYLLGTDALGRDILTRLMYGTRVSLLVAFVAAAVKDVYKRQPISCAKLFRFLFWKQVCFRNRIPMAINPLQRAQIPIRVVFS